MNPNFRNCPHCGIRNFSDDQICGVCKAPFANDIPDVESRESTGKLASRILPFAVVFVVAALFIWVRFRSTETSTSDAKSSTYNEVDYSPASPGGMSQPPRLTTSQKDYSAEPPPIEYFLDKVDINTTVKFGLTVWLNRKASNNELFQIAETLRLRENLMSNRGAIFFLLPEMTYGNGAWACVDYKPSPSVRIIGKTLADEQIILESAEKITDYLGLWVDNFLSGPIIMRMRLDDAGQLLFEIIDANDPRPSEHASSFIVQDTEDGKLFIDPEDTFDRFQLLANGDLAVYDKYGLVAIYKKLKVKKEIWNL